MKKVFLGLLMAGAFFTASAQQNQAPCLTDEVTQEFFKENPAQAEQLQQQFYQHYEQQLQKNTPLRRKSGTKHIIPVVFHVVHLYGDENISKEQIEDQIRVLNEDFNRLNPDKSKTRSIFAGDAADCEIEFRLATIDPDGNCTDGITRTYSTSTIETRDEVKSVIRWDNTKYLNIWVVKSIRPLTADQTGTTLGFAYLPWSLPATNDRDGVVVRADYVGTIGTSDASKAGRTLTHEVGHYLGLQHPFNNGCGGSDCTSTGDRVCDTPPVTSPSFNCPIGANTCSNDNPDRLDQIENFMDYANGNCQNMFTWGQKALIDVVLSGSTYRQKLVSNSNLVATGTDLIVTPNCAPKADFSNQTYTICAGNTIKFKDLSWGGTVTSRTWTFAGGLPGTSSDAEPTITYNTPGTYAVNLQVGNSVGNNQLNRTAFVVVLSSVASTKAPLVEGFENATFPPQNWTLSNSNSTKNWERTTAASSGGTSAMRAVINTSSTSDEIMMVTLPAVDLTTIGATGCYINFKVAYAARPSVATERLRISYSTDCGNNWILLSQRTGSLLTSTASFSGASFVPAGESDWRLISLPLNNIIGVARSNVQFRFEAYSNGGNSIYLDDINISANITSVPTYNKQEIGFALSPNPSTSTANLSFTLPQESQVNVKVYDITGRLVKDFGDESLNQGVHNYTISKLDNNLTDGIYFVKVLINNVLYTDKLVFVK